jgi:hypothetical protein
MNNKHIYLVILVAFLSSCGGGGSSASAIPLPSVDINANSYDINLGDAIEISWSSNNSLTCSASWTNATTTSGSASLILNTPGDNNISISCQGEGGSSSSNLTVFVFDLGIELKSITLDEDNSISKSINANPNSEVTLSYEIISEPLNGSLQYDNANNNINYTPAKDFNGADSFIYSINVGERNLSINETVEIQVNPVNDPPILSELVDDQGQSPNDAYSNATLIFEDVKDFFVEISDVDNELSDLTVYATIGDEIISGNYYQSDTEGESSVLRLNMKELNSAGFNEISICVSDESLNSCSSFSSYFISNKTIISIGSDCRLENGEENCFSYNDHYLYYLVGSPDDQAATEYVFIGDRLTSGNIDFFRDEVLDSVNTLVNSDAGSLINGFFSIAVIEEVALTELSAFEIEMGCYPSTPNVYCINDVSRPRIENAFNYDVAAFISSLPGRGVAQGDINIQELTVSTEEVVMHELGHSHGYMGDEYDSGEEYDTDLPRADTYINTTSVNDPDAVKWRHYIEDLTYVAGQDYNICFNYSDGEIYYRDQVGGGLYEDCQCFFNQFPDNEVYTGENEDPECVNNTGVIPGTYYDEYETYRPLYWTVMEYDSVRGYGKVNIEGFAYGSIMNQGFDDFTINGYPNTEALTSSSALQGGSINFTINAKYDPDKVRLKWYKDGIEQAQFQNSLSVSFNRPENNSEVIYSWVVEDLSGLLNAPNDPLDPLDFYEGWFEYNYYYESDPDAIPYEAQQPYVGSWRWYSSEDGYLLDNQVDANQDYMFAEICCSMSAAIKIKWSNYDQPSSTSIPIETKRKSYLHISANPDKKEKIFSLNLSKNKIKINSIKNERPNKKIIRRPFLKKNDIYSVNFFNEYNELIYRLGIGNPFELKIQHIGYSDKHGHSHNDSNLHIIDAADVNNLNLAIPSDLNPTSISLSKRGAFNVYNEISRIAIK